MATTDAEIFVDTNIWLYATDPASPWNTSAKETLDMLQASGQRLVMSPQVVREYLAVATRPGVIEPAPSLPDLLANVANIRARCQHCRDNARLECSAAANANTRDFERYTHLIEIVPLVSPQS